MLNDTSVLSGPRATGEFQAPEHECLNPVSGLAAIPLCVLLQYWEDEAAVAEGALFRGHFQKPSALVEYIMFQVNPGPDTGFQVEWPSIIGNTPWFAVWQHMSDEEFRQFYGEKMPEKLSELE